MDVVKHKVFLLLIVAVSCWTPLMASDHADGHLLSELGRSDARIADFYVFTRDTRLVFVLTLFSELPPNYEDFHFHNDVVYRIHVDRESEVVRGKSGINVRNPSHIQEDVIVSVRFDELGSPTIETIGLNTSEGEVRVYFGIRDEPFIRSTRHCKDIAAIVLELPLKTVLRDSDRKHLIAWSTTDLLNQGDGQDDLAGHPYRTQQVALVHLNYLHPSKHASEGGAPPDVLIFDTGMAANYPNGRDLHDDVVSDLRLPAGNDEKHCGVNEWEFLSEFPYLAESNKGRSCPVDTGCRPDG